MFLVVDSNVLLDYPQILQDEENEIVLITDVLKELDGLKKSENGETAFKARRAAIVISRNIGKIMFVNEYDKVKMTVDDKLPENDMPVVIEDDVWCGANVTILKGVTIGRGSVIAAGAVVTQSFPPYSIIGGVPAKLLKRRFTEEQAKENDRILYGFCKG